MQTSRLNFPYYARISSIGGDVDRVRVFDFDPLFEPQVVSTLLLSIFGRSKDQVGSLRASLSVGATQVLTRRLVFSRRARTYRFSVADIAQSYGKIRLTLRPQGGREFVIQSGVLSAPDPRYVYQVKHKFRNVDAENAFGRLSAANGETSAFHNEPDADDAYSAISSRVYAEGATVSELIGVANIDDPSGINRTLEKNRIAVRPGWDPKIDGLN